MARSAEEKGVTRAASRESGISKIPTHSGNACMSRLYFVGILEASLLCRVRVNRCVSMTVFPLNKSDISEDNSPQVRNIVQPYPSYYSKRLAFICSRAAKRERRHARRAIRTAARIPLNPSCEGLFSPQWTAASLFSLHARHWRPACVPGITKQYF